MHMEIPLGKIIKRLRDNGRRQSERRQEERRIEEQRKVARASIDRRYADEKRDDDLRRTTESQRQDGIKRWLYAFFAAHRMPKAADFVKSTNLLQPTITLLTALLTALAYSPTMGMFVGTGVVLVLSWHESGHYIQTKKCGHKAKWWLNVPFLGAIMKLPQCLSRISEAMIAYGGPAAGFWCSFILACMWILWAPEYSYGLSYEWSQIVYTLAIVSTLLNLFNMITLSPLDGGRMCQAMSWYFPQIMPIIGFIQLALVTVWSVHSEQSPTIVSMIVIWILVVGELPQFFRNDIITAFVRFALAFLLFLTLLTEMYLNFHGFIFASKEFWEMVGESMAAVLGALMVWSYYRRYRYPEEASINRELPSDNEKRRITWMYFLLLGRLAALFVLLLYIGIGTHR